MRKCNIDKELLIKEYTKNKKSVCKIAKKLKCSIPTIYRKLHEYNIRIRNKRDCQIDISRNKRKNNSQYIDGRTDAKHYCIESNCNNKISYGNWKHGSRRCGTCSRKLSWQNKEYRERHIKSIMKSLHLKPNKPERLLNAILNKLLPREYKFVGDGKVLFCGFNPDFINCNGQKKIIELYGDYWHNKKELKERDKRRLVAYKKYGYKTLIVWEHELKDINKLKEKILEFN